MAIYLWFQIDVLIWTPQIIWSLLIKMINQILPILKYENNSNKIKIISKNFIIFYIKILPQELQKSLWFQLLEPR